MAGGEANTEILLCFGEQLACRGYPCPPWSDLSRTTMLHELAHTWMTQNLSDSRRAQYTARVGLRWASDDDPWEQRGIERAAVVIVWGVHPSAPLPHTLDLGPRGLAGEFRLLTGVTPLAAAR